jgi:hypothetical protein
MITNNNLKAGIIYEYISINHPLAQGYRILSYSESNTSLFRNLIGQFTNFIRCLQCLE